jgi:putative proteasome-type protease
MTYCVGLYLREGIVLLSDTRTNAGVDNISVFSKMQVEEVPGERVLTMLSAGNLAITQAVWNRLQEGVRFDGARHTLRTVRNMFHAA